MSFDLWPQGCLSTPPPPPLRVRTVQSPGAALRWVRGAAISPALRSPSGSSHPMGLTGLPPSGPPVEGKGRSPCLREENCPREIRPRSQTNTKPPTLEAAGPPTVCEPESGSGRQRWQCAGSKCSTAGGFRGPGHHAPRAPRLSVDLCGGVREGGGWVKAPLQAVHTCGPMSGCLRSGLGDGGAQVSGSRCWSRLPTETPRSVPGAGVCTVQVVHARGSGCGPLVRWGVWAH